MKFHCSMSVRQVKDQLITITMIVDYSHYYTRQ